MYNLAGDPRCYESILYLPRPVSATHLPMPLGNRAAQFSSFDALSGLGAAIQETARQTEAQRTLDEDQKSALNAQLLRLRAGMGVTVVYFQPDPRKAGGAYLRLEGSFQKLDLYRLLEISYREQEDYKMAYHYASLRLAAGSGKNVTAP